MKKFILIISTLIIVGAYSYKSQAQQINVSINIGSQPAWGPVGYDYVDYYYLPDINVYYIINSHSYVYLDGRRWITARYLPPRYRNYDLYGMYKVVLVGGPRYPWQHNKTHYREYSRYRNHRGQSIIRDSRDTRYRESRNNSSPWYRESRNNRTSNISSRPSNTTRPYRSTTRPASRPRNMDSRDTNTTNIRNSSSRVNANNRSSSTSNTRSSNPSSRATSNRR